MDAKSQSEQVEARRQHLLATLRSAALPMSTTELYESCPNEEYSYELCPLRYARHWASDGRIVAHTHATVTTRQRPGPSNIYHHLRQLEGRGLIERVRFESNRSVYWRAVLSPEEEAEVNQEIDRLEAALGMEYEGPDR